jgi:hypothetical protein
MKHKLTKFARRLLADTDGQVIFFVVLMLIVLLGFMLAIPNVTQVTTQKMRMQTAADAGALTAATWIARGLNLSANMNHGIRCMGDWMTALTASAALAFALDTVAGTKATASEVTFALFGQTDPHYTCSTTFPLAIKQLGCCRQWICDLQADVAGSFLTVAQILGAGVAAQDASAGNPASQNPGGSAVIGIEDSLLTYDTHNYCWHDMCNLGGCLCNQIPNCGVSHCGNPCGQINIDSGTYDVTAQYGVPCQWATLKQGVNTATGAYQVWQYYDSTFGYHGMVVDSAYEDFTQQWGSDYWNCVNGYVWIDYWLNQRHWNWWGSRQVTISGGRRDSFLLNTSPIDMSNLSVWQQDSINDWHVPPRDTAPAAKSLLQANPNYVLDSSYFVFVMETTKATIWTNHAQGARILPRRLNPDANLYAVSYVWRQGASQSPLGLAPKIAKFFFSQSKVAPPSPMLAVARAEPYLNVASPDDSDYYFTPYWDVKLVPLDSTSAASITSDPAYSSHNLSTFNLNSMIKYGLLP